MVQNTAIHWRYSHNGWNGITNGTIPNSVTLQGNVMFILQKTSDGYDIKGTIKLQLTGKLIS